MPPQIEKAAKDKHQVNNGGFKLWIYREHEI